MTAEGHLIFALASTILAKKMELSPALAHGDWWHIIAGGLLTCLLPDIDHPQSFLGQRLKWLSMPIARVFGHRGFTHSLLAIMAGFLLFTLKFASDMIVPPDAFHGMIIGYLSHIVADMLTPAGVPLLWPCRWRFRLPIITSQKGNQWERILCVAVLIFAVQHPQGMPLGSAIPVPGSVQALWLKVRGSLFPVI
ncbi:metal-dependent hydrolase [Acerihabitans sp. KWT182]|uniref:Metal-dependent hydrolase n=1 Tax=Acerihabitans sp. KWT182 TaxID=3157919 RepID=A0AAU7Q5T2_9GAMM